MGKTIFWGGMILRILMLHDGIGEILMGMVLMRIIILWMPMKGVI